MKKLIFIVTLAFLGMGLLSYITPTKAQADFGIDSEYCKMADACCIDGQQVSCGWPKTYVQADMLISLGFLAAFFIGATFLILLITSAVRLDLVKSNEEKRKKIKKKLPGRITWFFSSSIIATLLYLAWIPVLSYFDSKQFYFVSDIQSMVCTVLTWLTAIAFAATIIFLVTLVENIIEQRLVKYDPEAKEEIEKNILLYKRSLFICLAAGIIFFLGLIISLRAISNNTKTYRAPSNSFASYEEMANVMDSITVTFDASDSQLSDLENTELKFGLYGYNKQFPEAGHGIGMIRGEYKATSTIFTVDLFYDENFLVSNLVSNITPTIKSFEDVAYYLDVSWKNGKTKELETWRYPIDELKDGGQYHIKLPQIN